MNNDSELAIDPHCEGTCSMADPSPPRTTAQAPLDDTEHDSVKSGRLCPGIGNLSYYDIMCDKADLSIVHSQSFGRPGALFIFFRNAKMNQAGHLGHDN